MRRRLLVPVLFFASPLFQSDVLLAQTSSHERIPVVPVSFRHELDQPSGGKAFHTRLLTALGGAAVGAGVGFFASQVVKGDWDEAPGRQANRTTWAAVGGSLGLALGFSVGLPGGAVRAEPPRRLPQGRKLLSGDELREAVTAKTAFDAVEMLRPEWLNTRGVHVIGETPDESIMIYIDESRLGGIETLHEVNKEIIRTMHFVDPGPATVRWGAGHSHGVILITTTGGYPRTDSP